MTKQYIEGLMHLAPYPDITPLQRLINRLYIGLRIKQVPEKEVLKIINQLLVKHNIPNQELYV